MTELLIGFILALGINIILFIPAFIFKTDKLTDVSYGLSFFTVGLILFLINDFSIPSLILFSLIAIWSIRIGAYLFVRIKKMKRDKRFDGIRESFVKFGSFWLIQGLSVFVILIPSIFFFSSESELNFISYIGLLIWLIGISIEGMADHQKFSFKSKEENKDKWIESGLWKYSRHPNYFGEILIWIGVFVFTFSSLTFTQSIIGLISPIYITCILLFFSGIPKLEKRAMQKWGENQDYLNYKKRTSVLILWPNKKNNP